MVDGPFLVDAEHVPRPYVVTIVWTRLSSGWQSDPSILKYPDLKTAVREALKFSCMRGAKTVEVKEITRAGDDVLHCYYTNENHLFEMVSDELKEQRGRQP